MFGALKTLFGVRFASVFATDLVKKTTSSLAFSLERMRESSEREARHETFEEAVERLELTPKMLAVTRHQRAIESRIMYILGVGSLVYGGYFAAQGDLLGLIGCLSTMSIGLIGGVTRAFRAHQIDKQELMSFHRFLRSPEGWIK